MANSKNKHFKANVLLKSIIGKDLINDDNIAVFELVKNSYDANSPRVNVIFRNLKANDDKTVKTYTSKTSKIIIQDFGTGMSEPDLEDKWLNIAYSEKKFQKKAHNRTLAGAKGVGRFSCDRLGEYLEIYTRQKSGDYLNLSVDWKSFEVENQKDLQIQHVDVRFRKIKPSDFKQVSGYDEFNHGTILEISKLRSIWAIKQEARNGEIAWDALKIISLKSSLEKLINPNQEFSRSEFKIFLQAPEFKIEDKRAQPHDRINCEIKNQIFEKLEYTSTSISSKIDAVGKVIRTAITDKGRDIFVLEEKNINFPLLKNISIVLYFLNRYSKIYFARQTGIRSIDFGSVYLFINGFRVPPFGDFNDDWLGIDTRKGQGYARNLGTREIVGRVEIYDDYNHFRIVSSREGIVKNENYAQLIDKQNGYFYYTFKRLEKYVVDGLDWDRIEGKKSRSADESPDEDNNTRKYIKEFEKKVNSKNWKFSPKDEKYFEDQNTKNQRILSIIDAIIDVDPKNIISLYINDQIVTELIEQQKEKSNEELKRIIDDLDSFSEDQITSLVEKIVDSQSQLDKSIQTVSSFPQVKLSTATAKALKSSSKQLRLYAIQVDKEISKINQLLREKKKAEEERQRAEEARLALEEENRRLQEELELEREKNTYLRTSSRTLSEDAKGLVHNIKIVTKNINSNIDTLYDKILNGKAKQDEILRRLGIIKFNSEKVFKISTLITRSNFKTQQNEQIVDLPKYIEQYISIYADIYEDNQLKFTVKNNGAAFTKKVSLLDVSVVLDDLISNSAKAKAKNVAITITNPTKNSLKILFSDDGIGVPKTFLENPDRMFELGVTTTDGSGIGLNSIRTALKNMKGEIVFAGNGEDLKGAAFELTFK